MNQPDTSRFFKTLRYLFFFFLAGQVLFGGVVWWLLWHHDTGGRSIFTQYGFLAAIILGWMIISSSVLYRQRLKRGANLKSQPMKLNHYRTRCIFRWAMLELGNLAVIGIAFLETNSQIMLLFALGIAVFFLTMPSPEAFRKDYEDVH